MTNLWKIALLSLALTICGACNDDDEADTPLTPNANNIAGTWQLTQFDGATLAEGSYVYVEFIRKDMKFKMYDNLVSSELRILTGEFNILEEEGQGTVIRGKYDHAVGDWQHVYRIDEFTAERMVWTAMDDPQDVSVYERCAGIPEDLE